MIIEQTEQRSLQVSQEKLLSFVLEMLGASRGREDDEYPLPPGPWDPVIRQALERLSVFGPSPEPWRAFDPTLAWTRGSAFGPRPEPWRILLTTILAGHPELYDAIGGGHSFGEEVALNPQPLPPRAAFFVAIAHTVKIRAELLQEIADSTRRDGTQQGIIIIGGYLNRFSDDWCGNGFRLKWPFPGPRPPWFTNPLQALDLVLIGAQLHQGAQEAFNQDLRRHLADASTKFVETGLSKIQ